MSRPSSMSPPVFTPAEWLIVSDLLSVACDALIDAAALLKCRNAEAQGVDALMRSVAHAKRLQMKIDQCVSRPRFQSSFVNS